MSASYDSSDSAKFELCLVRLNRHQCKFAENVVHDTELLLELWNFNNIHKSSWIPSIKANFPINADGTL